MTVEGHAFCLTPPGRGAIATIAVLGGDLRRRLPQFFSPAGPNSLGQVPLGQIVFGRWGNGETVAEEVVVCFREEICVEIHCHGGRAAVERIMRDLESVNFPAASMQFWTRSFEQDLVAAEAREALARCTTERTAAVMLDQYRGALTNAVESLRAIISRGEWDEALQICNRLLSRAEFGRHLTQPWRVVLAGPPNVGKSLLINRLLGYERAIVFDQPGTTRDVLTGRTALDGWPIEFADTAGLRISDDAIESAGVDRARRQLVSADLVVFVRDVHGVGVDQSSIATLPRRTLHVRNKIDLLDSESASRDSCGAIDTSALAGKGIDALSRAIVQLLIPVPPAAGEPVPFTDRQVQRLNQSRDSVKQGDAEGARRALEDIVGHPP